MILNATNIAGGIVLDCSEYNGDFMNSKTLKIYDSEKNEFSTTDYVVEKARPCFGNGGMPWIMLKTAVSDNFLKKGNMVVFE
jgi:hypothetical protein